jgi:hypothetical protein
MGLSAAPPAAIDAALLPSGRGRMAWQATAAEGVIPYLTQNFPGTTLKGRGTKRIGLRVPDAAEQARGAMTGWRG